MGFLDFGDWEDMRDGTDEMISFYFSVLPSLLFFPGKFGEGWKGLLSSVEKIISVCDSLSDTRISQLSPAPPVSHPASSLPCKVLDLHSLLLCLQPDLPGLSSLTEGSSLWKLVHQVSPTSSLL